MKKCILLIIAILSFAYVGHSTNYQNVVTESAQLSSYVGTIITKSGNANVYNNKTGEKVGTQYISINLNTASNAGIVTLGNVRLNARITYSTRDNANKMNAYQVLLTNSKSSVDAVITQHDNGHYNVVVYYADGTLIYDF